MRVHTTWPSSQLGNCTDRNPERREDFKIQEIYITHYLLVENPSDVQSHIIIEQQQAPIPTTRPFRCPASALGHLHRHVAASFPIPPCARTLELAAVHPGKATCQVIRGSKP